MIKKSTILASKNSKYRGGGGGWADFQNTKKTGSSFYILVPWRECTRISFFATVFLQWPFSIDDISINGHDSCGEKENKGNQRQKYIFSSSKKLPSLCVDNTNICKLLGKDAQHFSTMFINFLIHTRLYPKIYISNLLSLYLYIRTNCIFVYSLLVMFYS